MGNAGKIADCEQTVTAFVGGDSVLLFLHFHFDFFYPQNLTIQEPNGLLLHEFGF